MSIDSFKEAVTILQGDETISFSDSFDLAAWCSSNLANGNSIQARDLVIRAIDNRERLDPQTLSVWYDVVESAGLHPYLDGNNLSGSSRIRWEYHRSAFLPDIVFHEEQLPISLDLLSGNSVVVSAPTSFGKSLLIEEVVASKRYSNIVVIQPTIALLDETRKRLRKYNDNYNIIVSTTQSPSVSANIFLFTAERVVEYKQFPKIDFFVLDEFYKLSLSRDDERAVVLNHAFYKLAKHTNRFYMLGPLVRSVPQVFQDRFDFKWIHTQFQTVAVDEKDVKLPARIKKEERQTQLFELIDSLEDQTLVYCSSPQKATTLALEYSVWKKESGVTAEQQESETIRDVIEWIAVNIHPDWGLVTCLESQIGFHHGSIPRHLGSSLVDLFNAGDIDVLFCTSTLIEGVNTTARNVVLFDKKKGPKYIDYFDYRNIAGRSGRMKKYYIGRVFRFYPEPEQLELDVDIPVITQEEAPLELLVQLDPEEIIESRKEDLEAFAILDPEVQQIIRSNSGIPVQGQIELIEELSRHANHYHKQLSWRSIPSYDELRACTKLIWYFLLSPKDNKARVSSPDQLAVLTRQYQRSASLSAMIKQQLISRYWQEKKPGIQERVNEVTFFTLRVLRNWFDFRLPKLLTALSFIQNYVFTNKNLPPGDYTYYALSIENSFLPPTLSAVLEYDVPPSALHKILSALPSDRPIDEVITTIRTMDFSKYELSRYELFKLRQI